MSKPISRKRKRTSANFKPTLNDVKLDNEAMEKLIDKNDIVSGLIFQLNEANDVQNATLKQKNREMKEKIESLKHQIDGYSLTETSLQLTISLHYDQIKLMDNKLAEMQKTCDEYEKKIKDLEEQVAVKSMMEKELHEDNNRKVQRFQETIESLEHQINEYSLTETSLRSTIERNNKQRKLMEDKYTKICIKYENTVRDLENELENYKKKMKEEESQRKAAEEISNKLSAEVDVGTAKINELQSAFENSNKKIKDLEAQLASNEAKFRSEIEEEKTKIKRFQEKLEGRERRIKNLENEVESSKKIVADLESKLAQMEDHHKAGLALFLKPFDRQI